MELASLASLSARKVTGDKPIVGTYECGEINLYPLQLAIYLLSLHVVVGGGDLSQKMPPPPALAIVMPVLISCRVLLTIRLSLNAAVSNVAMSSY